MMSPAWVPPWMVVRLEQQVSRSEVPKEFPLFVGSRTEHGCLGDAPASGRRARMPRQADAKAAANVEMLARFALEFRPRHSGQRAFADMPERACPAALDVSRRLLSPRRKLRPCWPFAPVGRLKTRRKAQIEFGIHPSLRGETARIGKCTRPEPIEHPQ